jgi:EAL domain-containing protein (putative c-di-GMP-specific phosphodiesterase class I)
MPVDERKIDRAFVMGIARDPDDEIIVRSTIAIGHNIGVRVVAEGVGDAMALENLRALQCDVAQGYHVGQPLTVDGIELWILWWAETAAFAALPGEV